MEIHPVGKRSRLAAALKFLLEPDGLAIGFAQLAIEGEILILNGAGRFLAARFTFGGLH